MTRRNRSLSQSDRQELADDDERVQIAFLDSWSTTANIVSMEPNLRSLAIVLPPALLAEVEEAARQAHLPVAELVRELVEQGLGARQWITHVENERQRARTLGLPEGEAAALGVDAPSAEACIAKGMHSLREGRSTDGDTFMAELDFELAELERQGH